MDSPPLHLVKVPLRVDRLLWIARRRGITVRDLDDGYLVHCLLREVWQDVAPAPFVVRGSGRTLDVWGYSSANASVLTSHARDFGDPAVLEAMDNLDSIASREMPRFEKGRVVGFLARVCPVVRLARDGHGHHAGAEVDAYVARSLGAPSSATLSRDDVYREWFQLRMKDRSVTGAEVLRVRLAGISSRGVVRRTQGEERRARTLQRPDVHVEGELSIVDGDDFVRFLGHGVGRHRAFGFGAVIVVPPGTTHEPH